MKKSNLSAFIPGVRANVNENVSEDKDEDAWDDFKAVGGDPDVSIEFGASNKGNTFSKMRAAELPRRRRLKRMIDDAAMDWDTSDERDPGGRLGTSPKSPGLGARSWQDPQMRGAPRKGDRPQMKGLPPEKIYDPDELGMEMEIETALTVDEATPFGGQNTRRTRSAKDTVRIPPGGTEVTPQQAAANLQRSAAPTQRAPQSSMTQPPQQRTRAGTPTSQFQRRPNTPMQAASAPPAKTAPGEHSWDVYVDGAGVYKVPAPDEQTAKTRAADWLSSGGDPDAAGKTFPPEAFQAVRAESSVGGSIGAGPQRPLGELGLEIFRQLVNNKLQEIVRKKEGGGGYALYAPNKGKKKAAKPVGEFPTRIAAKRAELARFPPKDPEQLKRARKRLDKLAKDPKKRQDAERKELSAKKPRRAGRPSADRKKAKKEAIIAKMVSSLSEKLFREDEVPGSPWDERIASLHPDALGSDKKLHKYSKGIEDASRAALGDSHKALAKVLRGLAKVHPGDVMRDPDRGKMYMPIGLDVGGSEVGPIHLYIDGGNVCIEISQEARDMIGSLEQRMAKDLRGGLMSFQEDALPKIDRAKRAWAERDGYLDKLHQRLEKSVGGMSGVELHLARQLMNKRRR